MEQKLAARNIAVRLDKKAMEKLGREGYDPDFGARPLRRLMQREIQDPLALKLLAGEFSDGDKLTVGVDDKTGGFKFSKNGS